MPRSAATRSCSTIAPVASILAGEIVPQNGQTSACRAGFQTASAPQAGQANFCCAISSAPRRERRTAKRQPSATSARIRASLSNRQTDRSASRAGGAQVTGSGTRSRATRHRARARVSPSRANSAFSQTWCERGRLHIRRRVRLECSCGIALPICARCDSAPSGRRTAFSDSAQRSTVIALRNCLPAFFQLCAASPRSVSASQPRAISCTTLARGSCAASWTGAERALCRAPATRAARENRIGSPPLGTSLRLRNDQECRN